MQYVWFTNHEHGRVTRFRDYMNPMGLRSAQGLSASDMAVQRRSLGVSSL
jgi:hypothetical protein